MRRDYDFEPEEEDRQVTSTHRLNMHPIIEPEKKGPMFTRGQLMSMFLSIVLLGYALLSGDVPLIFLLISFLSYLLRPLAEKFIGTWLSNAMKGFSMAMGMGALALAFF